MAFTLLKEGKYGLITEEGKVIKDAVYESRMRGNKLADVYFSTNTTVDGYDLGQYPSGKNSDELLQEV